MVIYKLTYAQGRGLGETARLIFHYASVPFKDHRILIHSDQWPSIKADLPFGQIPVLYVDQKPIPQSNAINRYLARKYGLNGKDDFEAAQLDAIADFHQEVADELRPYIYSKLGWEPGDPAQLHQGFIESTEKLFPVYVRLLKESGSGFFAKSGVSWIDFLVASYMLTIKINEPDVLKKFPELTHHVDKVHALPQLKDYIGKRPQTPG